MLSENPALSPPTQGVASHAFPTYVCPYMALLLKLRVFPGLYGVVSEDTPFAPPPYVHIWCYGIRTPLLTHGLTSSDSLIHAHTFSRHIEGYKCIFKKPKRRVDTHHVVPHFWYVMSARLINNCTAVGRLVRCGLGGAGVNYLTYAQGNRDCPSP